MTLVTATCDISGGTMVTAKVPIILLLAVMACLKPGSTALQPRRSFVVRISEGRLSTEARVGPMMVGAPQPRAATSVRYPWVYPGNFNERVRQADIVVSGTIVSTVPENIRVLDGVEVRANKANIKIDRIFKGGAKARTVRFLWFSPAPMSGGGVIASLPPLARFVDGRRYLVFLCRKQGRYVVTVPVYAIDVRLASAPSAGPADLSEAPEQVRKLEMAQELERAALSVPQPDPGVTGEAATYFPHVVDLIGGCAGPFLRHFAKSQSKELAAEARRWLAVLVEKGLQCNSGASVQQLPI